jgi:hypothetical protein
MYSGIENILFIKKNIYNEFLKINKLFMAFIYFFFFPCILAIEGMIIFKLTISFHKYDLHDSAFFFVASIWVVALFLIATSSLIQSIKKIYSISIIQRIIDKHLNLHINDVKLYVIKMRQILGHQLIHMLNDKDFKQWESIKSNTDTRSEINKLILIDKALELYPSEDHNPKQYFDKAEYKYKQIDHIY